MGLEEKVIQKSAVWLLDLIFGSLTIVGIFIFFATIVDLILSPLIFIWTGELESVVSKAIINCFYFVEEALKLTQSLVSVTSATGLKGLDLMTNNLWEWQQSFYGRLKILSIGSLGAASEATTLPHTLVGQKNAATQMSL